MCQGNDDAIHYRYVLDTATPLTMVLSSTRSVPTTTGVATRYWHGLDTLAQSDGTSIEYFSRSHALRGDVQ